LLLAFVRCAIRKGTAMKFSLLCRVWMCGCFAIAGSVCAQESVNNASVSGRVSDATGAVVQDAMVTARSEETNLTSTATSDREGRFRFLYLRVGRYELQVQ